MKKVLVLGAGLIGKAIAVDLCRDYEVTSADKSAADLKELSANKKIKTVHADLSKKKSLQKLVQKFDLVIGAVPGFMGYQTVQRVIEAGKNMVDISFFPEDPFHLNKLAHQKEVITVVNCGVAPGLSNIICGYHHQLMEMKNFECYVGGLPKKRIPPYEYKAPFSTIDVIEEYTRPARLLENDREVVKEALSEIELLDFNKVGKLEAFNSDGLRSLIQTIGVPNMKEKTLRYPGHADKMRLLRDTGFFRKDAVLVNGKKVCPLDVTTQLLFPLWKPEKGEREYTVMRIVVEGWETGKKKSYTYDLYDEYDPATGFSSMARTTGYTCTAAARLVLEGDYRQQGISPPEYLGAREDCFKFILNYLAQRKISIKKTEKKF